MSGPYFCGPDGEQYFFADIASQIATKFPDLVGKNIFQQLDALGLREAFNRGHTTCGLPHSFSEYVKF